MQSPFEEHGRWWLPNLQSPGNKPFFGKLTWDPSKGAELEAAGLDNDVSTALSQNFGARVLVQGQLDTIPCVTLEDALVVSITPAIFGPGRVKLSSYTMTKGDEVLGNIDETRLVSMSCELTGLDAWVGGKTIKITYPETRATVVECLPYEETPFADADGVQIAIARWNRTSNGALSFSAQGVFTLELSSAEPFTFEKGKQILDDLKAFLTLALDRPVIYEAIRGRLTDSEHKFPNGKAISRHIEFFQTTDEHMLSSRKKDRNQERIPFRMTPIERSATAFERFREIYRNNRMALDFFFSGTYGPKSYINQQFADMVHGLEGLHRGLRGGRFIEQESYDSAILPMLVAAIPSGTNEELRTALKKRLEYGNEFSLRRRLKDIARFHKEYASSIIGKHGDFSDSVADLRNRLAHANGSEPPNRETVTRYFIMLHRVRLLFQLEIFHHLGFDPEFLKQCAPRLASAEFASRPI